MVVDPDLDDIGLKSFLEEALATDEIANATINSVFEAANWDAVERILGERCDLEVFASSRLVIRRVYYGEICANSRTRFKETAQKFK